MSRARQQKAPLSEAIILPIFRLYMSRFSGSNPVECLVETRTVAWLLLGFEIAPRVAELCGLTVCCYIPMVDGSAVILILKPRTTATSPRACPKCLLPQRRTTSCNSRPRPSFSLSFTCPCWSKMGIRRHPACRTHIDSVHRCDVCPSSSPLGQEMAARRAPCLKQRHRVYSRLALGVGGAARATAEALRR